MFKIIQNQNETLHLSHGIEAFTQCSAFNYKCKMQEERLKHSSARKVILVRTNLVTDFWRPIN